MGLGFIGLDGCDADDDDAGGGGVGSALVVVVGVMERRASVDEGGVSGFCIGWREAVEPAVAIGGCINCCGSTG